VPLYPLQDFKAPYKCCIIIIIVKQQYLLHISSQCGELSPLTAEIRSLVWSTPANFNRFHLLVSLLHRRCSPEANQTLHDVWPSPELVHYIYFSGMLLPKGILPAAKFTLHPSLALSYIGIVTARHSSSGR